MVNKCYQKHKEKLQKEAREKYQNLFEEEEETDREAAIIHKIFETNSSFHVKKRTT